MCADGQSFSSDCGDAPSQPVQPIAGHAVAPDQLQYDAVSVAIKRFDKRLAGDRSLRNTVHAMLEMLNVET